MANILEFLDPKTGARIEVELGKDWEHSYVRQFTKKKLRSGRTVEIKDAEVPLIAFGYPDTCQN